MEKWGRASWWVVIPTAIFMATISFVVLIIPAVSGRRWQLPTSQVILSASGYLEPHISSAGPYTLEQSSGKRLRLYCVPEGASRFNDCLGNGFGTASANLRSASVTYFRAQGPIFSREVLVSADVSGRSLLRGNSQLSKLRSMSYIMDHNEALNFVMGGVGVLIILYVCAMVLSKVTNGR